MINEWRWFTGKLKAYLKHRKDAQRKTFIEQIVKGKSDTDNYSQVKDYDVMSINLGDAGHIIVADGISVRINPTKPRVKRKP